MSYAYIFKKDGEQFVILADSLSEAHQKWAAGDFTQVNDVTFVHPHNSRLELLIKGLLIDDEIFIGDSNELSKVRW